MAAGSSTPVIARDCAGLIDGVFANGADPAGGRAPDAGWADGTGIIAFADGSKVKQDPEAGRGDDGKIVDVPLRDDEAVHARWQGFPG